jgi:hypothetical protein
MGGYLLREGPVGRLGLLQLAAQVGDLLLQLFLVLQQRLQLFVELLHGALLGWSGGNVVLHRFLRVFSMLTASTLSRSGSSFLTREQLHDIFTHCTHPIP